MPKSQPFQAPELRPSDIYKSPTFVVDSQIPRGVSSAGDCWGKNNSV